MKKEKVFYTSPEVDVIELRVEGVICQSLNGTTIDPFIDDANPLTF